MTDNPNAGYYQSSRGSLAGFDQFNLPNENPVLSESGWSIDQLKAFLLNQSAMNFPSNEWLLRVEQMIRDHENDFDNPHRTTLSQIVGDIIRQVLGAITPGTIPETLPFFAFDAMNALPMSTIVPGTYSNNNLYRQTAGGWFTDPSVEDDVIGTDYLTNRAGIPLFSSLVNITPTNWATATSTRLNTTIETTTNATIRYPFTFYDVKETPVTAIFGVDLPMTQDLQVGYVSSFFVLPSAAEGKLRIYQPSDTGNYIEVDLVDGTMSIFADNLIGTTVRNVDGAIHVSVGLTSLIPTPDNKLRVVHINEGASGDGTRQGSLARHIFSVAQVQTTKATLNQPVMKNLAQSAATTTFVPDLIRLGAPSTLSEVMITMSLNLHQSLPLVPVIDPTILSFGPLVITRDQEKILVSVNGNPIFTSDILDGLNIITLSYSPTKLIFKDLMDPRQEATGTYPVLPTTGVSFGPFGGYLHNVAFYAQADTQQAVEYLNNG